MPPMTQRRSLTALSLIALLAATACSDGAMGTKPADPPGRSGPLGIIRGTVSGDSMVAEFVPMGNAGAVNSALSPAIYGSGSTVAITGEFVSLLNNTPVVGKRTWTFKVHMQNLLPYTIGSNYSDGNTTPPDTSGVFLFFSILPTVTHPTGCVCSVTIPNYWGLGNFSGLNQQYFWYKDRPTAVQGTPGSDTTSALVWKFIGNYKQPSPSDTVHSFSFQLTVNAAWPSTNDTAWAYSYNWKTDSLPDLNAEPRWKPPFAQVNQYTTVGTEVFNIGTDLVLTAANGTSSIYLARNDSMDPPKSASMAIKGNLQNAIAGVPIQAVYGLVQPGAGGKQAVMGIYEDHVAFVHLDPVTGLWSDIAGTAVPATGTAVHTYRIRKFGTLNLYLLCVDNNILSFITDSQLDPRASDFNTTTEFFGVVGNATGPANLHLTSTSYVLGTDGGGC